ncbi:MAG: AAA family ATPase, partial [bacterium]
MLKDLRIRNFALIDSLSISFDANLNILTGETGAGKTILINALNLVLGGRAFSEFIRSGEDSAEVEAAFHLEEGHPIYPQLESSGYNFTPDEDLIQYADFDPQSGFVCMQSLLATGKKFT